MNNNYNEALEKAVTQSLLIEQNFSYHPPKNGQPEMYEDIRSKAKELAYMLHRLVPESRERSLAITKLEECVMWANAGIARNGVEG